MKISVFCSFLFLMVSASTFSQYCNTTRYGASAVFTPQQLDYDSLDYGSNINFVGAPTDLPLVIYYPDNNADTATQRPFIVLIHGGGFLSGSFSSYINACKLYAARGFVAATISYRLGWQINCTPNNISLPMAAYRANQDARAAIRYCVENPAYRIDPDAVFILGSSAGAVTAYMVAYGNEPYLESVYPGIVDSLGGLDNSTNSATATYSVMGLVSLAGGLPDTNLIDAGNAIPTFMVHGTADDVVPYNQGYPYTCPHFPLFYGGGAIADRMENLDACYELCYDPGAGHGDPYNSNTSFIEGRIALFLKRTLCGDCRQIVYEETTLIKNDSVGSGSLALDENSGNFNIGIFPNPAHEYLTITSPGGMLQVTLIDMNGKVVRQQAITSAEFLLPVNDMAPGLYVVKVTDGEHTLIQKVLKQ